MSDDTDRINDRVLPTVRALRSIYTLPGRDGTAITDAESFEVDIIADVLIAAVLKYDTPVDELEDLLGRALGHALVELNRYGRS